MATKSLPAALQQALEYHVEQSDIMHDEELDGIMQRLNKLNESVERARALIHKRRAERGES
ncbi:hypothetical protein HMF8227_01899 [Saliniradius amylolyticus]|uniref:Uncharacterized protein n=1 Tax=Saliniradius amylolyticus TaxID=2183582 RepID=A0A2S2E445_9ALTE|nr:hypothetical protein [Saliniradius amylolyticus]AWL12369.1 hypothetical protein HMF8227_01899 [Saliniradius amylolyticus]